MKMYRSVRFVAAAALAGSALAAVVVPAATAGAAAKPKIYATCTGFIGQTTTDQLLYGCTTDGTGVSKITAQGVQETSGSSATVYWEDKATTTVTFTYALVTGAAEDCPTLLGVPATAEVAETVTVTGGTSKLSDGVVPTTSLVCAYSAGGNVIEVQDTGPSGTGMHL
jgi:hypothetical protein